MTSPRTPEDCDRLFAEHVNAGDLDALLALYEPACCLVQADGTVATLTAKRTDGTPVERAGKALDQPSSGRQFQSSKASMPCSRWPHHTAGFSRKLACHTGVVICQATDCR